MSGGYTVGIGALNADIIGMSRAPLVPCDSNPGFMRVNAGGVTRNILENAARLGIPCHMLSAAGDDAFGNMALAVTARAGVDVSRVLRLSHTPTSTYCAILGPEGDMAMALSDMRILEHVSDEYLEAHAALIANAKNIVLDPSLPVRAIDKVLELAGGVPVFADPVSTTYSRKLKDRVGRFYMLKPNRIELAVLSGTDTQDDAAIRRAAEALVSKGCKSIYVTLGAEGCAYADADGRYIRMKLRPADTMLNATGAGDAFTAAALYAQTMGYSPENTLPLCLAAGIAAIMSPETVDPGMSPARLNAILAENPPVMC